MSGNHNHHHHHTHAYHGHSSGSKNLLWASLLNFIIAIAEILGGIFSHSLSLLGDALHNLSDAVAVFIAYLAQRISNRESTPHKTFGYKRIEILAALFNAVVLIVICIYLVYEAIQRFQQPQQIDGSIMFIIATIGLVANLTGVILLQKDVHKSLNVRAAYLHLLGDTLSSILVIISGVLIIYKKWYWIDPVITIFISLYILKETYEILKQTVNILMQFVPDGLDIFEIKKAIEAMPEIENVHHVHVWCLNDNQIHFEGHVDLKNDLLQSEAEKVRNDIKEILYHQYHISHSTLQFEYNCDCDKHLIKKGENHPH